MMKNKLISILAALTFCLPVHAEIGAGYNAGTGVRAIGLAGNQVAIANDLSAVYWNPAALALLPVREFQAAFDAQRLTGSSEISGAGIRQVGSKEGVIERMRLSGLGAMTAIPTTQGGLTLALSFDRPFIFDDITSYKYESFGSDVTLKGRRHGDLNRWSGAFGVQVTENIAAGLSISVITGKEKVSIYQDEMFAGDYYDYIDEKSSYSYLGYTLTGGFLYYPIDIVRVGLRINAAMDVGVSESRDVLWLDDYGDYNRATTRFEGRVYSAPNGTLGVGVNLPWFTASLDARVTMPYTFILPSEEIPDGAQAKYYKVGAGVGAEVPLPNAPVVFRAGYSADEHDLYPLVHKFDGDEIDWEFGEGFSADGLKHTVSFGTGIFTSGLGFEVSYAYQTWGIFYNDPGWSKLHQRYENHRVATALIFRY